MRDKKEGSSIPRLHRLLGCLEEETNKPTGYGFVDVNKTTECLFLYHLKDLNFYRFSQWLILYLFWKQRRHCAEYSQRIAVAPVLHGS